jgi:hypothetical protein
MNDRAVQVGPDGAGRPRLTLIPADSLTRNLLVEVLAGMLRAELDALADCRKLDCECAENPRERKCVLTNPPPEDGDTLIDERLGIPDPVGETATGSLLPQRS